MSTQNATHAAEALATVPGVRWLPDGPNMDDVRVGDVWEKSRTTDSLTTIFGVDVVTAAQVPHIPAAAAPTTVLNAVMAALDESGLAAVVAPPRLLTTQSRGEFWLVRVEFRRPLLT